MNKVFTKKVLLTAALLITYTVIYVGLSMFYESQLDVLKAEREATYQSMQVLQSQIETANDELTKSNIARQELESKLKEHEKFEDSVLYRSGQVSRGEPRPSVVTSYNMSATAYGNHVMNGGSGDGLISVGGSPVEGRTLAVDPNVIPLGSRVLVMCASRPEVNGVYIAEDVGGDITGGRVDIYFDDMSVDPHQAHKRMMSFGVRDVTVHVLGK